jgi:uncharacterized protein (TIGR02246 family)
MSSTKQYEWEVNMKNADEMAIEGLVQTFIDGWNAADAAALTRPFTPDADFTAITGMKGKGRDVIAKGHAEILATLYRGSVNSAKVESIRFLRPDVAVADVTFRFVGDLRPFGLEHTSCGIVCTKNEGMWSIAVFRNMVLFSRPAAGPVERELAAARR